MSTSTRTFPDTFTKVLAHYPSGWGRERGPKYFEAYTKSGLVLEYGDWNYSDAARSSLVRGRTSW